MTQVYAGSAAAAAGIRPGDVITAAAGQRIADPLALHNFEGLQQPGAKVALQVLRDGRTLKLDATLREQPRNVDGGAVDPRLTGARLTELPGSTTPRPCVAYWSRRCRPAAAPRRTDCAPAT